MNEQARVDGSADDGIDGHLGHDRCAEDGRDVVGAQRSTWLGHEHDAVRSYADPHRSSQREVARTQHQQRPFGDADGRRTGRRGIVHDACVDDDGAVTSEGFEPDRPQRAAPSRHELQARTDADRRNRTANGGTAAKPLGDARTVGIGYTERRRQITTKVNEN